MLRSLLGRAALLLAPAAVGLTARAALAQYNPANRTPSGQPIPTATTTAGVPPGGYGASPQGTAGYNPTPAGTAGYRPAGTGTAGYTPVPAGTAGRSATEQRLTNAEQVDSGRGLEWFYVGAEGGVRWVGTDTLGKSGGDLLTGGKKAGGVGPGAGLFLGARFYVLTVGARVRTAWLPDSQYLSAGGEVGLHVPMGDLEPHVFLGGGYATLLGVDEKVRGFDVNLGGGLDYYLSNSVSLGALASVELLRLSRPAFEGAAKASGTGLSVTGSAVVGLHFLAMLLALVALLGGLGASAGLWRGLWLRGPAMPRRVPAQGAALGAALALVGVLVERWMARVLGSAPGEPAPLYVALGFAGPLGQGLALLAVWPFFRRGLLRGPLEAAIVALGAGLAGGVVEGGSLLLSGRSIGEASLPWTALPWPLAGALLLSGPLFTLLPAPWSLVVGRSYGRSYPRPGFLPAWLASAGLHGLAEHLFARRTPAALGAALVVLVSLVMLLVVSRRSLRPEVAAAPARRGARTRRRLDVAQLLAPRDAPVSLRWVLLGVMVNQGTLVATVAAAVLVGNYLRVDFAAIDTVSGGAVGPLLWLGSAVLLAFPVAGFLVTRASGVPTLLEPALASLLALVGLAVLLGVAAPVGLVVLLAAAPVALALSCAGGWLGLR